MLGRGEAELQYGREVPHFSSKECGRVKPQSGECSRSPNTVRSRRHISECTATTDKPEKLLFPDRDHHILEYACSFAIASAFVQITAQSGIANLDHEFRGALDLSILVDD